MKTKHSTLVIILHYLQEKGYEQSHIPGQSMQFHELSRRLAAFYGLPVPGAMLPLTYFSILRHNQSGLTYEGKEQHA